MMKRICSTILTFNSLLVDHFLFFYKLCICLIEQCYHEERLNIGQSLGLKGQVNNQWKHNILCNMPTSLSKMNRENRQSLKALTVMMIFFVCVWNISICMKKVTEEQRNFCEYIPPFTKKINILVFQHLLFTIRVSNLSHFALY